MVNQDIATEQNIRSIFFTGVKKEDLKPGDKLFKQAKSYKQEWLRVIGDQSKQLKFKYD